VRFNGTSATFSNVSDNVIIATVPAGATTGPISVLAPAGTATTTNNFTVELLILSIAKLSQAMVAISWTTNAPGFTLQFSTNLMATNLWFSEGVAPVIMNGKNTVTNDITLPRKFYRLRK
jgi:hypothetical protein